MMQVSELGQRLSRLAWTKSAVTFFVNGPPGAGKSHLLKQLPEALPEETPLPCVVGPHSVAAKEVDTLGGHLMNHFRAAGFVDTVPTGESSRDLSDAWRWFADNAQVLTEHTFLVMFDLGSGNRFNLATLGSLFSDARRLAEAWEHPKVNLIHVFAGYWDHGELKQYFRDIVTSFPYTPGQDYEVWNGISPRDMTLLVRRSLPSEVDSVYGETVFELTGGHPAAALDILSELDSNDVSVRALLSATQRAAESGPAGEALLEAWLRLPDESRNELKRLILQRHIPIRSLGDRWEQLVTAGVARHHQVGQDHYLAFQSWYAELLARLNVEDLGIADSAVKRIRTNGLMPAISELNVQAYRVINDIENQARNFVATRLSLRSTKDHLLENRGWKSNEDTGNREDAYQRAMDWCQRSLDKGVLNPLLAYLSTRDLAHLVEEISHEIGSEAWQEIANAIMELSDIRDAVMHNQLIEGSDLKRLYELRGDIYAALSEC
jgi:hypothetical protein